ncbi:MAG: NAD(P)H-dependent oxidoreductase subunit E [Deltaproteobacteria bacterium]|nr:NAD(P)H-dependent oxidoreductase subunit E [Deltaproteobacteria bacterium]
MEDRTILIGSGDHPLREYLFHQISDLGWSVRQAGLVSELLLKVKAGEADVLILDSSVEGVSSSDLIPMIKRMSPRLPIIALADDSSLELSRLLRREGIFFLAMKPIDREEIRLAVGDALNSARPKERRKQTMGEVITLHPAGEIDLHRVHEICREHEGQKGHLLIVLQKIQALFGYVPQRSFGLVSGYLGVSTSDIFGVLTFYNRFHLSPRGKHTIRTCRGTACHFRGAENIIQSLRGHLGLEKKDTTADFRFSLEEVACLGACGIAPVMAIGEETFGHLTPALALKAAARFEAQEEVVEEKEAA